MLRLIGLDEEIAMAGLAVAEEALRRDAAP